MLQLGSEGRETPLSQLKGVWQEEFSYSKEGQSFCFLQAFT